MIASAARLMFFAVPVAVVAALGSGPSSAQTSDQTRAVYISAIGAGGTPVTNLTVAELSIKENDRIQPVVSLSPAMARISIALLVDDSGLGIDQFRLGIARLMNRLILDAEFALTGIAGQNQTLLDFTQQSDVLVPAVRALRARTGVPGQHVIEAVGDAVAAEERREAVRPVVIVLTNQSRESGNGTAGAVLDRLVHAGAVLHVVEVVQRLTTGNAGQSGDLHAFSRANDAADTDRARSQLLNDGPATSGGRRQQLVDVTGVPAAMGSIAEELAGQYVLVFHSSANAGDASKISIATTRAGVRIHAPALAGSRRIR